MFIWVVFGVFFLIFNFISCFVHFLSLYHLSESFLPHFCSSIQYHWKMSPQCMIGLSRFLRHCYVPVIPHTDPCNLQWNKCLLFYFIYFNFQSITRYCFFFEDPSSYNMFTFLESFSWEVFHFWKLSQIVSAGCYFVFMQGDSWGIRYQNLLFSCSLIPSKNCMYCAGFLKNGLHSHSNVDCSLVKLYLSICLVTLSFSMLFITLIYQSNVWTSGSR